MWNPPSLRLKWGAYFREDVTEQAAIVTMTVAAKNAGLITDEQAIDKLADIYGTEDADAVLEKLKEQAAERQKQAIETAKATKPDGGGFPPKKDQGQKPE